MSLTLSSLLCCRHATLALMVTSTLILGSPAQSATPTGPDPFTATFEVGNNYITAGKAYLSLSRQDERWTYQLTTRPKGLFRLMGKGRIEEYAELSRSADGRWKPLLYRYRQDDERSRAVDAEFDWQAGTMTYSREGMTDTVPLPDHLMDRFSITLDIWQSLRDGFTSIKRQVFDNGRLKTMEITREGQTSLKTPVGTFEAIIVRTQSVDSSRHQLTWFAPELGYLPVKIEQFKRGKLVGRMTLLEMQRD